jgi:hypothetical protein
MILHPAPPNNVTPFATQKVLWDVTDKIYNSQSRDDRQSMDEELVSAGRSVLKSEWEKIKAEMRGEPFKTGE